MALAPHPVWPFPPNWNSSVTETLEWLTDVLQSPTGSEQRRCLRFLPRKSIDFSICAWDDERTLLDNLLMSHSAGDWYLPLWYDAMVTTNNNAGPRIPCAPSANITAGSAVFITGSNPFDYQVGEVASRDANGITLTAALGRSVPAGTIVHPMTVGRLIEQPPLVAITDGCVTAEPQFLITEDPRDSGIPSNEAAGLTDTYRDFYVLNLPPNWTDRTERGQERLLSEFDNQINTPVRTDTALRPFPTQKMQWILDGAGDHQKFYSLLQILRGRTTAVWVPTWMDDFRIAAGIGPAATTITVARSGFVLAGGPRPERQDIVIELVDGRRFYRRITNATSTSTTEVLTINQPFGVGIAMAEVLRIAFISLMRLDHDSVQIDHLTDLQGVSEVDVTFRAAPNSRLELTAFGEV